MEIDPEGGSSKFPSLAFGRALAGVRMWQGADGTRSFLSTCPHPVLWLPGAPTRQLQLKAKLKAAGVAQRWFPGLGFSPPLPLHGEGREGRGGATLCPLMNTSQREETEALGKGARRQGSALSCCSPRTARGHSAGLGRSLGAGPPPPVCASSVGRDCAVQKMCAWGGGIKSS